MTVSKIQIFGSDIFFFRVIILPVERADGVEVGTGNGVAGVDGVDCIEVVGDTSVELSVILRLGNNVLIFLLIVTFNDLTDSCILSTAFAL